MDRPAAPTSRPWPIVAGIVFAVAVLARVLAGLHGRGFTGSYSYDAGVYFTAAEALTYGHLPYRDFVLLHPPGLPLVLTPFALLGRAIGDSIAFTAAGVATSVLGGVNAVLVTRVARRLGSTPGAALIGGLAYALWIPSVLCEHEPRLEPLGNFLVLIGLLVSPATLGARPGRRGRRADVLAGAALGASASVKIWGVVPLLVVVGALMIGRRSAAAARTAVGAALAGVLIDLPFFAFAPSAMTHMVVIDQLGRGQSSDAFLRRLREITAVWWLIPAATGTVAVLVLVGCAALLAGAARLAWTVPAARMVVVLLMAQVLVLITAPSYFASYGDFAVPAGAVVAAVAAGRAAVIWRRRRQPSASRSRPVIAYVAAAAVLIFALVPVVTLRGGQAIPGRQLGRAVAAQRCVVSDLPTALIRMNVLSRDFDHHCRVWVDITGLTYGRDRGATQSDGRRLPRVDNPVWQRDLLHYFESANAIVLARTGTGPGESRTTLRRVRAKPVLGRFGRYSVYLNVR